MNAECSQSLREQEHCHAGAGWAKRRHLNAEPAGTRNSATAGSYGTTRFRDRSWKQLNPQSSCSGVSLPETRTLGLQTYKKMEARGGGETVESSNGMIDQSQL
jgi:hypothetical protein